VKQRAGFDPMRFDVMQPLGKTVINPPVILRLGPCVLQEQRKLCLSTRNAIEPGGVDPPGAICGTRPPGVLSMSAVCRQIVSSACSDLECHRLREADPPKDCALRESNDIAFGEVDSP